MKLSCIGLNGIAILTIGECSQVGDNTQIHVGESVTIGKHVWISWGCNILDRDYHGIMGPEKTSPVVIGDNVWIGCQSIILKGVTIGHDAVVGAGSVVTKNVEPYSIVGGNPAKVIGTKPH